MGKYFSYGSPTRLLSALNGVSKWSVSVLGLVDVGPSQDLILQVSLLPNILQSWWRLRKITGMQSCLPGSCFSGCAQSWCTREGVEGLHVQLWLHGVGTVSAGSFSEACWEESDNAGRPWPSDRPSYYLPALVEWDHRPASQQEGSGREESVVPFILSSEWTYLLFCWRKTK